MNRTPYLLNWHCVKKSAACFPESPKFASKGVQRAPRGIFTRRRGRTMRLPSYFHRPRIEKNSMMTVLRHAGSGISRLKLLRCVHIPPQYTSHPPGAVYLAYPMLMCTWDKRSADVRIWRMRGMRHGGRHAPHGYGPRMMVHGSGTGVGAWNAPEYWGVREECLRE